MRRLRYAVIGTGMMGREHVRNLALLAGAGVCEARVDVVVDPDDAMRTAGSALARKLGGGADGRPVRAYAELVPGALEDVDAVVLASPNHTHAPALEVLLGTGLPILAEKPLATTVPDCEALLERLEGYPAPFQVAMEYRWMPPTARFLERVGAGEVGRLVMLSIREHRYPFLDKVGAWNRFAANTGGTLVEKCCHHFDLMRLVTGAEPVRAYASGAMDVNHLDERIDGRAPDIIDNACAIVDFDSGARATLELCMFADGADPQETLLAVGDRAVLEASVPAPARFRTDGAADRGSVRLSPRSGAPSLESIALDPLLDAVGDHLGATFHQHARFAACVLDGAPVAVTAADGAIAVAMGVAAQESIRTGRAVDVVAPRGAYPSAPAPAGSPTLAPIPSRAGPAP